MELVPSFDISNRYPTTGEIVQQIFARPLSGGKTAVVLLNRGVASMKMAVTWEQLGFSSPSEKFVVFDVIAQKSLAEGGSVTGKFEATVASHDVNFVILTPHVARASGPATVPNHDLLPHP